MQFTYLTQHTEYLPHICAEGGCCFYSLVLTTANFPLNRLVRMCTNWYQSLPGCVSLDAINTTRAIISPPVGFWACTRYARGVRTTVVSCTRRGDHGRGTGPRRSGKPSTANPFTPAVPMRIHTMLGIRRTYLFSVQRCS